MVVNPIRSRTIAVGKLHGLRRTDNVGSQLDETRDSRASGILCAIGFIVCSVAARGSDSLDYVEIEYERNCRKVEGKALCSRK